ncbi:MAG: Glycerophosphoryl diester phosphodiesterase (EC [uncultured Campylobacterales bacterium]|uniref:Glycerophosphoryl diester phosphodiesterase (EC) n=1 Tax=uncultured Campylobacterales bacterium TaxID=352960 RepID=A0A6S6TJC6_9BACT|nr:MAG: Glycerophosphoryl diester phosphodiesterase (EC [uncultured Campylobacterales bacterium]
MSKVIGHRGYPLKYTENTLDSFKEALKYTNGIEGDFHQSLDKQIVSIHDESTCEIFKKDALVRNLTLKELRDISNNKIPTLNEVFEILDDKEIYIEIKSDNSIVPILQDNIKNSNIQENKITIISFNENVIKSMKKSLPNIKALYLIETIKDTDKLIQQLEHLNVDGIGVSSKFLDTQKIKTICDSKYEYHVWEDNNLSTKVLNFFKDMKVDSITVDDIEKANKVFTQP